MTDPNTFRDALVRILRPLIRAAVGRGLLFPEFAERVKVIYIEAATRYYALAERRLTDSRISLLTGLQRKDVRAIRSRLGVDDETRQPPGAGPLPRVIGRWINTPPYVGASGEARALPRTAAEGPSFESLVAEVSRDIHPRTLLDEMLRLKLVRHDPDTDDVVLLSEAFVPSRDEAALAGYFGANLGDHAEAAVANLLVAPEPGPFFERAVHYDHLSPESLAELETLARRLHRASLAELNSRALDLQLRDDGDPKASGRFRSGAYVFREDGR